MIEKNLNIRNNSKEYMKKKGVFLEIGAILIILITSIGAIAIFSSSSKVYVGDKSNLTYFEYYKCKEHLNEINEGNQEIFSSKKEAEDKGFIAIEGCV